MQRRLPILTRSRRVLICDTKGSPSGLSKSRLTVQFSLCDLGDSPSSSFQSRPYLVKVGDPGIRSIDSIHCSGQVTAASLISIPRSLVTIRSAFRLFSSASIGHWLVINPVSCCSFSSLVRCVSEMWFGRPFHSENPHLP
jgi:hypothetical protein